MRSNNWSNLNKENSRRRANKVVNKTRNNLFLYFSFSCLLWFYRKMESISNRFRLKVEIWSIVTSSMKWKKIFHFLYSFNQSHSIISIQSFPFVFTLLFLPFAHRIHWNSKFKKKKKSHRYLFSIRIRSWTPATTALRSTIFVHRLTFHCFTNWICAQKVATTASVVVIITHACDREIVNFLCIRLSFFSAHIRVIRR